MTTEIEKEFFEAFGIETKNKCGKNLIYPNCLNPDKCGYDNCIYYQIEYPEITDRKLLQLLCLYNYMQGYVEYCITPCKYEDVKEMILSTLVNEKSEMIDCEEGTYMDVMTKQIQQLFKEKE